MNKSNTVEKGYKLEVQVYNIVKKLLANDECYFLPGKRSIPYLKKTFRLRKYVFSAIMFASLLR